MNIQTICKHIGESGCYFVSLLKLVHSETRAIEMYQRALGSNIIDAECFVKDPARLLSMAAGGTWSVRQEAAGYQPKDGELEILRFEHKVPMKTYAHFVVGDGTGRVIYDPLDNSQTVAAGQLVSKRIITRLA